MKRLSGALCFVLVAACGGVTASPTAHSAPADEARVRVPAAMPLTGTLIAIEMTPEEDAAGFTGDVTRFVELLGRVRVFQGARVEDGELHVPLAGFTRPAHVALIYDTVGLGLDALFGPQPGLARGTLVLPAQGATAALTLEGEPAREPTEACVGERQELVVIQDEGTRTVDDTGERRLCVYLPVSYASDRDRRYPVVFAFPGFSGWHANGNAWRQRALFDQVAAEGGGDVIVVGVGTRTAVGTSYLQSSARFGDWDGFIAERMIAQIDQRYRTVPRRGTFGHSTGGWNAIASAMRHPDVFHVIASSSPDGPDLDAWMFEEGALRAGWLDWIRVEAALGGRGQFASYAAAWSPEPSAPRGFRWPVDLDTGALDAEVYAAWRAHSPMADLETEEGRARAAQLSGRVMITAGSTDEFALFEPARRYAAALNAAGVETRWIPTEYGHFGSDEERMMPLVRFLVQMLH